MGRNYSIFDKPTLWETIFNKKFGYLALLLNLIRKKLKKEAK